MGSSDSHDLLLMTRRWRRSSRRGARAGTGVLRCSGADWGNRRDHSLRYYRPIIWLISQLSREMRLNERGESLEVVLRSVPVDALITMVLVLIVGFGNS